MVDATAIFETLNKYLADAKYAFVCPSPETQSRVVQKRSADASIADARNATEFFGWSLPCSREALASIIPIDLAVKLEKASIIVKNKHGKYQSTIRVSNFYLPQIPSDQPNASPLYYIHSSYPASPDSVFFGPDTYLFVQFLQNAVYHLPHPPRSIIDVCCGAGAGAIHMARTYPQANTLGLDLNPRALRLGDVNSKLAGTKIDFHESNLYATVPEELKSAGIDLIVSNPPYIASSINGEDLPIYADGGARFGLDISLRIVEEGMKLLSKTGVIILYTGVAIPTANPKHDAFLEKLQGVQQAELAEYRILHPDMWPEEIGKGAYSDVCRIQAVGAVLKRKG
ncbi:hypothetical protein ACN47E_010068 [Coniothyrium glycines]